MSRRERKLLRRKGKKYKPDGTLADGQDHERSGNLAGHGHITEKKKKQNKFLTFYEKNYKKNMWITIALLVISIIIIGAYTAINGEFIPRGVSLKGGVTITVPSEQQIDIEALQTGLRSDFPGGSLSVRAMTMAGEHIGFIVDASDVDPEDLLSATKERAGDFEKFSLETMGSALGEAFFKQTLLAILIAFVLMSIVVFLAFKSFIPSFAVILSAISDITMTVAAINILGIRIETAGIAALLMLIGYSVDTDILLTTRVLKRDGGTVFDRVLDAMKTGMTMTVTSLAAVIIALIFTQSETLKQIMLILLIGLIFDILNTWIQNVGIIRMYMEHKAKKKTAETLAEYKEIIDADYEDEEDEKEHKEQKEEDKKEVTKKEKKEEHHAHKEHKSHHDKEHHDHKHHEKK